MRTHSLSLKDKPLFDKYLGLSRHELAVYNFAGIYIWKKFFSIEWSLINESLCVFFRHRMGTFLYLTPLARVNDPVAVAEVFKKVSRIENAEEKDLDFYKGLGYTFKEKFCDYMCLRSELEGLRGNRFKAKRSSRNYFMKHYDFSFTKYRPKDKAACLKLYNCWAKQRQNPEYLYQAMLSDSFAALKEALDNYKQLGLEGRVVRLENKIKGFTIGYALNRDTFCVLYEITDLSVKGLAQFIFQRFAAELRDYKYINVMDDSGLANLKKVKLSYRPVRLVPAYIIKRKDA